jgi:regulator of nucleoside diphosphate kinase
LFGYVIRIANYSSLWSFTEIHKEIRKFKISRVGFAPLEKGEPAFKRVGGRIQKLEETMRNKTLTKETTIYITEFDRARLIELIDRTRNGEGDWNRHYLNRLEGELERAEVVDPKHIPGDAITMRSTVRLRDLGSGKELIYSLVFPNEADIDKGKISVLAPVGTAMIGYRVGDTIEWEVPAGLRRLKVQEILYQPEASGDYHM